MAANLREIVNFSLVIVNLELLTLDDEVREFHNAVDADVRPGAGVSIDAATGRTQQARTLHLDRDRININLSPSRSSFTREFPSVDNLTSDTERFAHIVDSALPSRRSLQPDRFDFGYNAEMVFDQDYSTTALEFLGQQLLRAERIELPNRRFIGGACRLIITDDLGQWTYNLEPRFNDLRASRVFISVNLHNVERPLPQSVEIIEAIRRTISGTQDFMNHLGG